MLLTRPRTNKRRRWFFIENASLLSLLAFVLLFSPTTLAVVDDDNAVIGSPIVECEKDVVRFRAVTKQPFRGRVYVKGEFSNSKCLKSYSGVESRKPPEGTMEEESVIYVDGEKADKLAKALREHPTDFIGIQIKKDELIEDNIQPQPPSPHRQQSPRAENKSEGAFSAKSTKSAKHSSVEMRKKESRESGVVSSTPSASGGKTEQVPSTKNDVGSSNATGETQPRRKNEDNFNSSATTTSGSRGKGGGGGDTDNMDDDADEFGMMESELRKLLDEFQSLNRDNRQRGQQKAIPSVLPAFSTVDAIRGWRNFLRGKPGIEFNQISCPLVCPPCDECRQLRKQNELDEVAGGGQQKRRRRAENSIDFEVPLGTCNAKRDRTANPPGIQVTLTIVVSFHDSFITRVDRAYNVQCAYQELQQNVDTRFDVISPPIEEINSVGELPKCEYRIKKSTVSTEAVPNMGSKVVQVGDTVQHEWVCSPATAQKTSKNADVEEHEAKFAKVFGLLVHNCYIEDGRSRKELIVDKRGCSIDPFILPTPVYANHTLSAVAQSGVVKFPDIDLIGFQCAITVCMRDLGHCEGVTPPDCSVVDGHVELPSRLSNRTRRDVNLSPFAANIHHQKLPRRPRATLDWQLHSPTLTVIDPIVESGGGGQQGKTPIPRPTTTKTAEMLQMLRAASSEEFCMSVALFGVAVSAFTFVGTVFAVVFISLVLLRHKPPHL